MIEVKTIIKISILALGIVLPLLAFLFFRKRRKEIVLLFLSLAFSILITEAFLRKFYPQIMESDQMFEYDPNLGWRFISNKKGAIVYTDAASHWIETNSLGFRDNSPPLDKDNYKKILVMGDSFVSNISVNDNEVFTEVMERQLNNTAVLNFGVNGYGQVQEYLLLKIWLDEINPDLIILMIYIRNDFNDNIGGYWLYPRPFVSWDEKNSDLIFHPPPKYRPDKESSYDLFLKFFRKSHFFEFFNKKFDFLIRKYFYANRSESNPSLYKAPELYLCRLQPSEDTKLMYLIMEALLMRIADYADEREVPLVFALAPSIIQVEDKLWLTTILDKSEEPENYKRSLPNDKLMQFAEKNNLLMIDLLPILQSKSSNGKKCYNSKEQHWNSEGNCAVANALIDYLKAMKLFKYIQ